MGARDSFSTRCLPFLVWYKFFVIVRSEVVAFAFYRCVCEREKEKEKEREKERERRINR